ncbi:MAG TPA: extracellular solute-binding protein [Cellulomonas sp.]
MPFDRSISRRGFLAAAGAVGAAIGLSACSTSRVPTVTLYETKSEVVQQFRQFVADLNGQQSTYHFVHDLATNLSASFVRNSPPDLGCLNYNLEMSRFMERGALSDLSDMPEAGRIRSDVLDLVDWYPGYESRTSVIPFSAMAAAVIYNKRIFADNGLEVPTTWDELIDVCERLQAAGITPIYATFADSWTIAQGWFDYAVGGMVDVRDFYTRMNELGEQVGPDSEVSYQSTLLEPVQRMMELVPYTNDDRASRAYGDGNTAMSAGGAAMYLQGPWALLEISKAETDVDLGTFPLPMTDDPADLKARINIDLSLWIPEAAGHPDGAREMLQYLMQPEIQHPYNELALGFSTTTDAPAVTDPWISGLQEYYDSGRFYMGASQFVPKTIPYEGYLQSIALGSDPRTVLAQLDSDWSRLAYRA